MQWVNYSWSGINHQLLANLLGSWSFKGKCFSGNANPDSNRVEVVFTGNVKRKSFANGRYFMVESYGDKIQMPVQNGKLHDATSIEVETEGYENSKRKFVKTRIGNHLGSGITSFEGDCDSATKTITYYRVET